MLNGVQLFDSFDERLNRAQREAAATQAQAEAIAARRDQARAAETEALRALTRLRLAGLRDGEAALGRLDAASERIRALLAERAQAVAAADAELAARRQDLAAAQAERDRRAAALQEAQAEIERKLAAARERGAEDPEWQRLHAAAEEAARIAIHAEQKAAFARQDLEAKGKPYRDDPLFAYLWDRGYGTARYRAGPLARLLDGWVARIAKFEPARRNYVLLSELPARLAEHAGRMRQTAEAAAAALAAQEQRMAGLTEGDGLGPAQDALEEAEAALDKARDTVTAAEQKRANLAGEEDAAMREAAAALEAALGAASLRSLRDSAARTPTPEDDAIVARLEAATAARERAERELGQARTQAETARARLRELQGLRQEMRQRGYGRDHWDFRDGALIGVLLGELLRGSLGRDDFWDRMGQHRVPGGGPWGGGPWDGGMGSGGFGTGGGFGGDGGFHTGGQMGGGGGFRTGGSF
ncbi:MAG: hypothetical protein IRY87_03850 [Acetobacteraceae bacterium]|nr:hypothetical protein [Acetobacteraceae bacterium]